MSAATERLLAERKNIRKNRGYMFYARPVNANGKLNIMHWECGFPGTEEYAKGYFKLNLFFKKTYPFTPPVAQFTPPVYHPNVYENGTVCLDLLGEKWKPCLGIERILYALQQLLTSPNIESPANKAASTEYETDRDKYWKKVNHCIDRHHKKPSWISSAQ